MYLSSTFVCMHACICNFLIIWYVKLRTTTVSGILGESYVWQKVLLVGFYCKETHAYRINDQMNNALFSGCYKIHQLAELKLPPNESQIQQLTKTKWSLSLKYIDILTSKTRYCKCSTMQLSIIVIYSVVIPYRWLFLRVCSFGS